MESGITSCKIRHRVRFAPDPKNTALSRFVDKRLVSDLAVFPEGVQSLTFDSVVEVVVGVPARRGFGGHLQVCYTTPFNALFFYVVWSAEEASRIRKNGKQSEIAVHPSLKDKIWVFGERSIVATQEAA